MSESEYIKICDAKQYDAGVLSEGTVDPSPFVQFAHLFTKAKQAAIEIPNAMVVSTVDDDLQPHARIVLLKSFDERGFVFYSNYTSSKGQQLAAHPKASLLFWWEALEHQIRILGYVEKVSREESQAYFASRPRESQIASVASKQSSVIANREQLERKVADLTKCYAKELDPRSGSPLQHPINCPNFWGGYRVIPHEFEFWQGRPARLSDRLRYRLKPNKKHRDSTQSSADAWLLERLAP